MSKPNAPVNSNLPKMIVREKTEANNTIPPLPTMPEGYQHGGEWMDPQWKKDIKAGKKLFTRYPFQMASILVATAGLAIGLGLAGNACAAKGNTDTDKGGYSEEFSGDNYGGIGDMEPDAVPGGLLGYPVEGSIDAVDVTIKGYKFEDDYEGKPGVVVEFEIENNGEENTTFLVFDNIVTQNGEKLPETFGADGKHGIVQEGKEVAPGESHTVTVIYLLENSEDPITVEVSDLFQISDDVVTATYSLAGDDTPAAPGEPGDSGEIEPSDTFVSPGYDGIERITGNVDDAYIEIFDYNLWEDSAGQKYIVVSLDETNMGSSDYPASAFYEVYAEQDGKELTHVTGGMEGYGEQFLADLAPGETRQIHLFFRGVDFEGGAATITLYNFFNEDEYVGIEAEMY